MKFYFDLFYEEVFDHPNGETHRVKEDVTKMIYAEAGDPKKYWAIFGREFVIDNDSRFRVHLLERCSSKAMAQHTLACIEDAPYGYGVFTDRYWNDVGDISGDNPTIYTDGNSYDNNYPYDDHDDDGIDFVNVYSEKEFKK